MVTSENNTRLLSVRPSVFPRHLASHHTNFPPMNTRINSVAHLLNYCVVLNSVPVSIAISQIITDSLAYSHAYLLAATSKVRVRGRCGYLLCSAPSRLQSKLWPGGGSWAAVLSGGAGPFAGSCGCGRIQFLAII